MFLVTDAYNTAYAPTELSAFYAATVTECINVALLKLLLGVLHT